MIKFLILAYKNLSRRKIRSLLAICGVGVAVAVLVSLLGFNYGYRIALEKDVSGMGFQVLVTAKGCPYELATVALSGVGSLRYLTDDTVGKIRADKEIASLTPTLLHILNRKDDIGFYTFWGIDLDDYTRMRPLLRIESGKHVEVVKDPLSGKEVEKVVDGPMGRWFIPREVKPDEIYLKNGRVLKGLIVGEGEFEKVTGRGLDLVSGEYAETRKKFKTIKIMLPSRVYKKSEIVSVSGLVTLNDGSQVIEDPKKPNAYSKEQVKKIEDVLTLKDGSRVTGIIFDDGPDAYNVGDIELAYPNTEEINQALIDSDTQGNLKIINNSKTLDQEPIEVVLGWEAAQAGYIHVGQNLALTVKDMELQKVKESVTDPETGVTKEIERETEVPVLKNYVFKVVGVLGRMGSKDDGSYFIQLQQAQRIFHKYKMLTDIGINLKDLAKLPMFMNRIYDRKELGETQIISLSEVKGTILNLVQTAKILVMSVAIIAILVSLIGVMNTILMSVFERTREIGIMKAIGASRADIFKLIWLETIIICTLGGLIGIIAAVFGGGYVENVIRAVMSRAGYVPAGRIVHFSWQIITGCFLGAIILGVLSGIWPAYRASSMRPVEAIRLGD